MRGTPGALRQHLRAWRRINTPKQVLRWLREGISVPFSSYPPRLRQVNYVPQAAVDFVDKEVPRLLAVGSVERTTREEAHCVLALSAVPKKHSSDGWRLILNARPVNAYVSVPHMKYEDYAVVQDMVEAKDWMMTADLSDGFHHLFVRPDHRRFLCFEWRGEYYRCVALPFAVRTSS